MRVIVCILMLVVSLGSSGCMKIPATSDEVRSSAMAGNFGTQTNEVKVNSSLKKVVNRVANKARKCMSYEVTMTGNGTVIITYVPEFVEVSKNKVSMILHTRFRQKSVVVLEDKSGIGFVADIERLSRSSTKVTTYSSATLDISDRFHDAVLSSAQGKKGECPAEVM